MTTIASRRPRRATIRVRAVDGTLWEGEGAGLARAVGALGRRHLRGEPAPDQGEEARWRLTAKGAAVGAAWRRAAQPPRASGEDR
jgi:hypothetical protein